MTVQVVGHGGAGAHAPANSLGGFTRAADFGVDRIEFDVLAHAGGLICAHDTRHVDGAVELAAALAHLCALGLPLSVDLKTQDVAFGVAVGAVLRAAALPDDVLVCGHHRPTLNAAARACPGVRRGWSVPEHGVRRATVPPPRWTARAARRLPAIAVQAVASGSCDLLMVQHRLITPALCAGVAACGAEIHAWTVDDPAYVPRLMASGVAAITTNDPPAIIPHVRQVR